MSRLVLSLQDGSDPTWVELTELPVVFEVDDEDFTEDWMPPADCTDLPHLHVKNLWETEGGVIKKIKEIINDV